MISRVEKPVQYDFKGAVECSYSGLQACVVLLFSRRTSVYGMKSMV